MADCNLGTSLRTWLEGGCNLKGLQNEINSSSLARAQAAQEYSRDWGAIQYIVVVLLFYSTGVIFMIAASMRTQKADTAEGKVIEEIFSRKWPKFDQKRHAALLREKTQSLDRLGSQERAMGSQDTIFKSPLTRQNSRLTLGTVIEPHVVKTTEFRIDLSKSEELKGKKERASPTTPIMYPSVLKNIRWNHTDAIDI